MNYFITYVIIFIYGILIGSFLNVCIYRIPSNASITLSRSHCMNCNTPIQWYDLIPVFSFLLLRGRCRSCRMKISLQYPIIEILNGFAYLLVFYLRGFAWQSVIHCLIISSWIVVIVINYRTNIIPNGIILFNTILAFILVGLEINSSHDFYSIFEYLLGAILGGCGLLLIFQRKRQESSPLQEVCFAAAIGLVVGWKMMLIVLLIVIILSIFGAQIQRKYKKQIRKNYYGGYIAIGASFVILFNRFI